MHVPSSAISRHRPTMIATVPDGFRHDDALAQMWYQETMRQWEHDPDQDLIARLAAVWQPNAPSSETARRSRPIAMFDGGLLRDGALEQINRVKYEDELRSWTPAGRAALEALDALSKAANESIDDLSIEDRDEKYIVSLSAPFVEPDDLVVDVEDGVLTVSGSTFHELWTGGKASAHFSRAVRLPSDADAEIYGFSHVDDVLTVEVPKRVAKAQKEKREKDDVSFADIAAEAEALAKQSPRFKRWLTAHGYLQDGDGEGEGAE